eukprot:1368968-Lingulodinium_polyedra.AAC.1
MRWARLAAPGVPVEFHYDSKHAAHGVMGSEHWHGEGVLQTLCRTLHLTLRCGGRVVWERVHGHCGQPWNELADA